VNADDARARWAAAKTPRERAEAEAAFYEATSTRSGKRGIEDIARVFPGCSSYEVRHRYKLWLAGDDAAPLWERLASGSLTLAEASRVMRDAVKTRAQTRGNVARRVRQLIGAPEPTRDSDAPPSSVTPITQEDFRSAVRALVDRLLASESEELTPFVASRIRKRFSADVAAAVHDMHVAVRSARVRAKRDAGVVDVGVLIANAERFSRRNIVDACRALSMDPPRSGTPIEVAVVNRQWKRLARLYHPDANQGGTPESDEAYALALAARDTLLAYNESLNEKETPHVEGREEGERSHV
jgi:hypothetical protein